MSTPDRRDMLFEPGKLWSLLDMFDFKAREFYTAVNSIDGIRAHYGGPGPHGLKSYKVNPDGSSTIKPIDRLVRPMLRATVKLLRGSLHNIGAEVTLIFVGELEAELDSELPTYERVREVVDQIDATLRREITTVQLLVVEPQDRQFYAPVEPLFGADFVAKFGDAAFDVEEAGKCLALGRATASAYHSLRTLEAGIYAMSRSLGIPDPIKGAARSWAAMLRLINAELENRWPTSSGRMSGDAQVFDELYGALAGMQNPYRNTTMHLADKYTQEEARHIFELVKGLMKRVAARMDSNGLPLA